MTHDSGLRDAALLGLRIGVGATLFAHGTQKLLGWYGGAGLDKTAAGFEKMGFRPGRRNAWAAGLGEAGGGALLALGLATPAAGAAVVGTMAVASSVHAPSGFFSTKGGYEFPATLGLVAAAIALGGPGDLSVDAVLRHRLGLPWMRVLALAAAVPAAAQVIIARRQALAADKLEADRAVEKATF
jgi:putative oxidoreductase